MIKTLVLLVGVAFAGVAQAQLNCWTGADGKRACGDTPPPGAKVTTVKGPDAPATPAPAAPAKGTKGAAKGPGVGTVTSLANDEHSQKQAKKRGSAKAE